MVCSWLFATTCSYSLAEACQRVNVGNMMNSTKAIRSDKGGVIDDQFPPMLKCLGMESES